MSDNVSKLESLSSAIYLITGFFNESEPMKWRLRMLAGDLVSNTIKDKYSIAREIRSLFGVAKIAGLVSDTNHEIMVRELSKLASQNEIPWDNLLFKGSEAERRPLLEPRQPQSVKDNTVAKPLVERSALKEFGAVSIKKNSRQSVIIGLLKRKKEIMIKDVSPLISGCSEKTIQRELSAMVAAGILKKIGEKRWSRYTLA